MQDGSLSVSGYSVAFMCDDPYHVMKGERKREIYLLDRVHNHCFVLLFFYRR